MSTRRRAKANILTGLAPHEGRTKLKSEGTTSKTSVAHPPAVVAHVLASPSGGGPEMIHRRGRGGSQRRIISFSQSSAALCWAGRVIASGYRPAHDGRRSGAVVCLPGARSPPPDDWMGGGEVAEEVGFEPTVPVTRHGGFQDRCIQPLCHSSGFEKTASRGGEFRAGGRLREGG